MEPQTASQVDTPQVDASQLDTATLDAIQLMLRDLHTRHDEIRHRAAFRGCTSELLSLQQELVDYLLRKKSELMGQQQIGGVTPNYNSFI